MRKKVANYVDIEGVSKTSFNFMHVDDDMYKGYACLLKFLKVDKKQTVVTEHGEVTFLDNNYKWLEIYPDENQDICLTACYNDKGEIFEYYFDIVKKRYLDEDGIPYIDDLYLDLVMDKDGDIIMLDEDELKDALDNNLITQEDYDKAFMVYDKLEEEISGKKDKLLTFCNKYVEMLEENN